MKLIKKILVSILLAISMFNGVAFAAFGNMSPGSGGIGTPFPWTIRNGELFTLPSNATINVGACNGCGGGISSVLVDNQTIFGDGINVPLFAQSNSNNKIISGGASWSGTGYVFDVSALTYWFDGVLLGPTTPTTITLDAADPTNDRFDAIVVDQAGTISKITGTASANPVFPAIPDTKLLVQYVNVGAGTTQPVLLQDLMYDENTGPTAEWTATQFDVTTGAIGTVNVAATANPIHGPKYIQATGVNYRRGAKLVRSTAIDLQQFAYVQVWYRNDGAVLPTTKNPYFQFQNSAGNPTGNNVNLLTYGASRTIVNTPQLVVIPVSAFGNITTIKGARVTMTGGTLASTANFSVDFMLLSGGILPQGAIGPVYLSPSNTLYSTGAGTGATAVTDSIFFGNLAGFQAVAASESIFHGPNAGYKATSANKSVFLGSSAGYNATSADHSIFIGDLAGANASNANNSTFLGSRAGQLAVNADNSMFIGIDAGWSASSAYSSSFVGAYAGYGATNAAQSVFIGRDSGYGATNASNSYFLGYRAGFGASAANASSFLGTQAGDGAVNASSSVFIGFEAGSGSLSNGSSIFIGMQAGKNSTATSPNILIGTAADDGGFSNSIGLGHIATVTADNQFMIGSASSPINQVVVKGTGGIQIPVGTTAERIATQGMIRYNTTTSKFEGYDGSTWVNLN